MTGLFIADAPRWLAMWTLAVGIYILLKLLSWWGRPAGDAPLWKHLAYLLAWPGMDAYAFLSTPRESVTQPSGSEWMFAAVKVALGVCTVALAIDLSSHWPPYASGWVGMVGIVLTLHFGLFHLLSCLWQKLGVQAQPIMNGPLASTGVSDFWSRRWNLAFRDLTSRFVVRPLRRPLGAVGAVAAGFVVSGLIHDLVISLPAGGGYGGPTVYFLLQAAAVFLERSQFGRRAGLATGWIGRMFAWVVVLGFAPLLLHRPFVERIIVPFVGALGELS